MRDVGVDDDGGVVVRLELLDRIPPVRRAVAVEAALHFLADGGVVFYHQYLVLSAHAVQCSRMPKVRQAQLWMPCTAILVTAELFAAEPTWVQHGPHGSIARVITKASECPRITIDGIEHPMRVHSSPASDYPVTVCEASVAAVERSASIGGTALPVAKLRRSERIAILGDTGCRRKAGSPPQDCSDP